MPIENFSSLERFEEHFISIKKIPEGFNFCRNFSFPFRFPGKFISFEKFN